MPRKIISFSLYGNSKLYCQGAIENIFVAKKHLPDWRCLFYVASDCPALEDLRALDCDVIEMPPQGGIDRTDNNWKWDVNHCGMFWRNYIIDDLEIGDAVLFRDADSRISRRDAWVVNDWMESPYIAARIAENPSHHNSFFMGIK